MGEVSERVVAKLPRSLGFVYGEPPLSRTKTTASSERVAAKGQPAVPPPTIM